MSKPTSSTWSLRARNRCKPSAPSCASSCTPSTACSKTTSRSTTRASTPYRRELIAIDNEQSIYEFTQHSVRNIEPAVREAQQPRRTHQQECHVLEEGRLPAFDLVADELADPGH